MAGPHICHDMYLPGDRARLKATGLGLRTARAIAIRGKLWTPGQTIRIRFLEGTKAQHDETKRLAANWLKHANLNFLYVDSGPSEVRIRFQSSWGAYSYIGTDCLSIPQHAETMNLGWLDGGVVEHEFGHMIGLGHEHQNPEGGIVWNEAEVIEDLSGPPNYWDEATIRWNVLDHYTHDQVIGTVFDEDSIMLYGFPDSWVQNGSGTKDNSVISAQDAAFIASRYPGALPPAVALTLGRWTRARIGEPGEVDWYELDIPDESIWRIETRGKTDTLITLYGADRQTMVAQDNDSGWGESSRIITTLSAGKHFLSVRNLGADETGRYRVGFIEDFSV